MERSWWWKAALYGVVTVLACLYLIPSVVPTEKQPAFIQKLFTKRIQKGLDGLFRVADGEWAQWFFHEAAGLVLMMPMALLLLWFELWLLGRLLVEPAPEELLTVGLQGGGKFRPHPVPHGSTPGR